MMAWVGEFRDLRAHFLVRNDFCGTCMDKVPVPADQSLLIVLDRAKHYIPTCKKKLWQSTGACKEHPLPQKRRKSRFPREGGW